MLYYNYVFILLYIYLKMSCKIKIYNYYIYIYNFHYFFIIKHMGLKQSKHPLHTSSSRYTVDEIITNKKLMHILKSNNIDIENSILENNNHDVSIPKVHKNNLSINYEYLIQSKIRKKNNPIQQRYLEQREDYINTPETFNTIKTKDSITISDNSDSSLSSSPSPSESSISYGSYSSPTGIQQKVYDTSEIISAKERISTSPAPFRKKNTEEFILKENQMDIVETQERKNKIILEELNTIGYRNDKDVHSNIQQDIRMNETNTKKRDQKNKSNVSKFLNRQIKNDIHTKMKKKSLHVKNNNEIKKKSVQQNPCLFGKSLYTS